jgi:hypothetical protein
VNFTTVLTNTNIPQQTVAYQLIVDESISPIDATHIRLRVTKNHGSNVCAIGEIELYGYEETVTGCLWTQSSTDIHYSDGNVGINTSVPAYKLDVDGDINLTGEIRKSGTIWNPSGGGVWTQTNANIHYTTGNVGIGTTNPTHTLTVSGTIRAKEIIVDDANWPDYVFTDDYHLQPLDTVERHIQTHKHLPGIPSAQEIAKTGVSLGEMQTLLLAKIEELTLHQIELNKRLNAQDEKLEQQSRKIDALQMENTTLKNMLKSQ